MDFVTFVRLWSELATRSEGIGPLCSFNALVTGCFSNLNTRIMERIAHVSSKPKSHTAALLTLGRGLSLAAFGIVPSGKFSVEGATKLIIGN